METECFDRPGLLEDNSDPIFRFGHKWEFMSEMKEVFNDVDWQGNFHQFPKFSVEKTGLSSYDPTKKLKKFLACPVEVV